MRKLMLLTGIAALGLSAPLLADPGGRGGGRGQGHGGSAHAERHGGGERGRGRGRGREARGGNEERAVGRRGADHVRHRMNRQERRVERAIQQERRIVREARRGDRRFVRDDRRFVRDARRDEHRFLRDSRRGERRFERFERDDDRRFAREARRRDHRDWRGWSERRWARRDHFDDRRFRRLAFGCPPGLARQNAFCLPPGQLRRSRLIGQRLALADFGYNVPVRYRYRFVDDDRFIYRYGNDGAIYRLDRANGLVSSVIPLVSSGLFVGEPLPLGYDVYNVPFAYRDDYADTSDYLYRYDDNAIYRVDAESNLVEGIVALLAGGDGGLGALGVGDLLPSGYDAYNVPLDYRDTYYDTDDSLYRYADGSIYEVDPSTGLIESVISLLT